MEGAAMGWNEANAKEKERKSVDKEKVSDMRKKATESLSETRKQKEMEGDEITPRRKRKSDEVMTLLDESVKLKQERAEKELKLREDELQE